MKIEQWNTLKVILKGEEEKREQYRGEFD
jgi:hypothetical protein